VRWWRSCAGILDDFEEIAERGFGGGFGVDEEDGGAVGAGAGGRVQEMVVQGLEMGVSGVDVGDGESEMGEGRAGFIQLAGDGAGGVQGRQELELRRTGGWLEEDLVDLVRTKNIFTVDDGKTKGLVGLDLRSQLVGGDGEGEMVDSEKSGEVGDHFQHVRAKLGVAVANGAQARRGFAFCTKV